MNNIYENEMRFAPFLKFDIDLDAKSISIEVVASEKALSLTNQSNNLKKIFDVLSRRPAQ